MPKVIDLTGKKFGMLEVIEKAGIDKWGHKLYLCRCECGEEKIMKSHHIQKAQSCGCQHGQNFKTHGMGHTRLNYIWSNMKARCQNPNIANYQKYGARGIRVCEEWRTFEPFMEWALENGYTDELSIDRIDPNGNYEPDNCRWVDNHVQANNKNSNVFIEFSGEKKKVAEWAVETGINSSTILKRLRSGWDIKDILTKPVRGDAKGH